MAGLQRIWIAKWSVPGSKPGVNWTVAVDNKGEFGCSCPVWKFKRKECKHIIRIKTQGAVPVIPQKKLEINGKNKGNVVSNKKTINVVQQPVIKAERIVRSFDFDL